ncbi:MAG: pilus assembly protein TadG-related protein [Pseudomonadota bacterium]|nr:pilus assembly protein TadG-related protein [Pseudomonadota bacterium]
MIVNDPHLNTARFDGPIADGSDLYLSAPTCQKGRKNQRGAITIMFALMATILIGFIGVAMSVSMIYNRKAELQTVADNAAVAAANQLVGTQAGVQAALAVAATQVGNATYQYHKLPVTWTDAAIKFSASATAGSWVDAGSAQASPSGLIFTRVDTSALDAEIGTVSTILLSVLPGAKATTVVNAVAVAGRASINITPLAICALSPTPANPRSNLTPPANVELEEYGFRRGVGYDLMKLNSNVTQPAENFVIDPIAPLGSISSSANIAAAVVGPFVCMGRMPRPRVIGATLPLSRPFPLSSLFNQLNSRFDQYVGGLCTPSQARPDANIKAYVFGTSTAWMKTPPAQSRQTAAPYSVSGTIASRTTTASSTDYGPLWAFAKAVPYSSYVAGTPEPTAGYTTFPTTNAAWATLYPPGPIPNSYPAPTPYSLSGGSTFQAPSAANGPGVRFRRVLNVPLLSCPVAGGSNVSGTVLAIGKFFMTVPATSTSIYAEFAGVVPEQSLGGPVELFL